jgi:hypothetical protein
VTGRRPFDSCSPRAAKQSQMKIDPVVHSMAMTDPPPGGLKDAARHPSGRNARTFRGLGSRRTGRDADGRSRRRATSDIAEKFQPMQGCGIENNENGTIATLREVRPSTSGPSSELLYSPYEKSWNVSHSHARIFNFPRTNGPAGTVARTGRPCLTAIVILGYVRLIAFVREFFLREIGGQASRRGGDLGCVIATVPARRVRWGLRTVPCGWRRRRRRGRRVGSRP